ncbi:MAG: ChrR family anti-sigma-E factor [Hyphomicrobiaceae bacterium]
MSITHHPHAETLAELASGHLDSGRSIVIAAHLERCRACARQVRLLEAVGGQLIEDAVPEPMSEGALARMLGLIDAAGPIAAAVTPDLASQVTGETAPLPAALSAHGMGGWQWVGPGIHRRMVEVSDDKGARVFLLKARPGTRMPDHTHTGSELTLVLSGAFSHSGGRFGPGDLEEADDSVEHQPLVEPGGPCICLVAMEGSLRLKGLAGRLLQPFLRL